MNGREAGNHDVAPDKTSSFLPGFVAERWQGKTSLRQLFWRDLLGVGTFVNLLFGFTALILLAKRADASWSLILHTLTLPYNLFLVSCVWRHVGVSVIAKVVSATWLLAVQMV